MTEITEAPKEDVPLIKDFPTQEVSKEMTAEEIARMEMAKEIYKQRKEAFARALISKYLEKVNFEMKRKNWRLPRFKNFEELAELFMWFFGKKNYVKMLMNGYLIYHRFVPRIYSYFLTMIAGCGDNKEFLEKTLAPQDGFRPLQREHIVSLIGAKALEVIESLPDTFLSEQKPKEEMSEAEIGKEETE